MPAQRLLLRTLPFLLLLLGGCLLPPRAPLEVSDSQLNWLSIRHRPAPADAPPSRIEIIGAGYIDFMQGASPRVADSFATDTDHADWGRMTQEKIGLSPAEARRLLQRFVDAGLLAEPPRPRGGSPEGAAVATFRWRINNQAGACLTSNPAILAIIDDLTARLTRRGP